MSAYEHAKMLNNGYELNNAPLANRLGIWQIKWELEDLAFRFLEPATYKDIARLLDEKRTEREHYVAQLRSRLEAELRAQGIAATVSGRPKHIYSIVKKMRGKSLPFAQVFDIRAVRVVVDSVPDCYAALSWVHSHFTPLVEEFDDYIARPKSNGYQSLHTVVRDAQGRAIEVQIRTQAMHAHAELGVAAHWAYKEAGSKGYAGVAASKAASDKIALMRQLLAWEREMTGAGRERIRRAAGGRLRGLSRHRREQNTRQHLSQAGRPIPGLPAEGLEGIQVRKTRQCGYGRTGPGAHRCRHGQPGGLLRFAERPNGHRQVIAPYR